MTTGYPPNANARRTLRVERLRELLDYDPETGVFRWRESTGLPYRAPGSVAGTLNLGYRQIRVDAVFYRAHRLAFFYTYGRWPEGQIDHRNRNRDDNRLSNLREVTRAENSFNIVNPTPRNRLGVRGVSEVSGKYRASVYINGKNVYLGTYDTPEEASFAYHAKKQQLVRGGVV